MLSASQQRTLDWIASHGGTVQVSGETLIAFDPRRSKKRESCIPCLHLITGGALHVDGGLVRLTDYGRSLLQK